MSGVLLCVHFAASALAAEEWSQNDFYEEDGRAFNYASNEALSGFVVYRYSEVDGVQSRRRYVDGQLHGITEVFYTNGAIEQRISYKMGELEGLFQSFYKSGQLAHEGHYKAGLQVGAWKHYDEAGQLLQTTHYAAPPESGKLVLKAPKPPSS